MPRGTYLHLETGAEERFQCAPGPGGWRYVAELSDGAGVDLTVDSRWRQIRVQVTSGDWMIRGGMSGTEVLWVRSPVTVAARAAPPGSAAPDPTAAELESAGTEFVADAAGFVADSPAFLVAVARLLRLSEGAYADVRLVRLSGPALAPLAVAYRWALTRIETYDTDLEPLPVESYEITDLATAEQQNVQIAGDVVVEAPGIELTALDGPPNLRPASIPEP